MSNAFYDSVAQVLEVDEVGFGTDFRQVPGWCSLQAFGLLVLMENDWNAPLDIVRLKAVQTVGDMYCDAFVAFLKKCKRSVIICNNIGIISFFIHEQKMISQDWSLKGHLLFCCEGCVIFG